MKTTKTKKIVMIGVLVALGIVLNLIEIPYPFAPWLMLDLSEIVILIAVSTLGLKAALCVGVAKFIVSILIKGPVGPFAIGQITALIASLSIAFIYYFLKQKNNISNNLVKYIVDIFLTMVFFALIMFIINYLFVTPTYLMQKPTWYTQMTFNLDITAFNKNYGSNLSVPNFLKWLSPYGQAIFIIYFPFNFIKGIMIGIVYYMVRPVEKLIIKE